MSRIRVAALAMLRDGSDGTELLLVREHGTHRFMLPGGKYEPGETTRACLARELDEELSLALSDAAVLLGRFEAEAANEMEHRVEATVFRQDHEDGPDPKPTAEIAEVAWLALTQPLCVPLAPLVAESVLPMLRGANLPSRSA